jgi:hypothetical protein
MKMNKPKTDAGRKTRRVNVFDCGILFRTFMSRSFLEMERDA